MELLYLCTMAVRGMLSSNPIKKRNSRTAAG
jgi:hypothetical protein